MNIWADWGAGLKNHPGTHAIKQSLTLAIMISPFVILGIARKFPNVRLSFSWVLSLVIPILAVEIACINFPKVENVRTTEAIITIVATFSMMSYN
jgi:hypothetical protein